MYYVIQYIWLKVFYHSVIFRTIEFTQTYYNCISDEKAKAELVVNAYKDDVRSKLIRLEIMKKVNGAKMFMRPLSCSPPPPVSHELIFTIVLFIRCNVTRTLKPQEVIFCCRTNICSPQPYFYFIRQNNLLTHNKSVQWHV